MVRPAFVVVVALLTGCEVSVDAFRVRGPDAADAGPPPAVLVAPAWYATVAQRGGALWAWGAGEGQPDGGRSGPVRLGHAAFVSLERGDASWCGLDGDGAVWCQGRNEAGQLGTGDLLPRDVPSRVTLPDRARRVSLVHRHACAVLVDASLWCWGANFEGQLGLDDTYPGVDQPTPRQVRGQYLDVGVGDGHSCGVLVGGELRCWGRNTQAQLGLGSVMPDATRAPTPLAIALNAVQVRSSMLGSCALTVAGEWWCWGARLPDVAGEGPLDVVPTRVGVEAGYDALAVSPFHACARRAGAFVCLGRNVEGQLGLDDTTLRAGPTPLRFDGGAVTSLALGRFHTCLTTEQTVWCAGRNDDGQLGVGDLVNRPRFVEPAW